MVDLVTQRKWDKVAPNFDFMASGGSFAAAAKRGLQRLEGKDYVIKDGDIAHFRFNVGKA